MHSLQAAFKLGCLLAAALLLQCCSAEQEQFPADFDQNLLHVTNHNISQYYAQRCAKAARDILRDTSVITNHNEQVEIFKQNLMAIVADYYELKRNAQHDQSYEEAMKPITNRFYDVSKTYIEPSDGRSTKDNKFIVNMLEKYGSYRIYTEITDSIGLGDAFLRAIGKAFVDHLRKE